MRRSRFLSTLVAGVCSIALLGASGHVADTRTVVIVVRHAEKASATDRDPVLSEAGTSRANALAAALQDAGVSAVITTQFQRTRLTAQPLADKRGLTAEVVQAVPQADVHARAVADAVRKHEGGTVLVVGHSNTVPAIIAALGGPKMPDLCDSAYSNLFIVVLGEPGGARLVRSRYGAADPPADATCANAMTR